MAFTRLFARFRAALENEEKPTWALLEPDERPLPENILACYLCALSGIPALDLWKAGFETEVNYWASIQGVGLKLDWEQDRNEVGRLRMLLAATQTLQDPPTREQTGD
ncbi:MAG: hypothetical protein ACREA0_15660 [bacterium]